MKSSALTPFRTQLANFYQRLVHWFKRFRFQKLMGWILILKTFNIVWLALIVALFVFITIRSVKDEYEKTAINVEAKWKDFNNYKITFEGKYVWNKVDNFLETTREKSKRLVSFIASPFVLGTQAILNELKDLVNRLLIFLVLIGCWLLLTFIATAYSQWSHGPAGILIRGESRQLAPGAFSGAKTQSAAKLIPPHLETPPVLIIDRARVSLPVLLEDEQLSQAGERSRSFGYAERFLLSAQAVWPDRFIPLYYYQLSEHEDASDWALFWQNLIERGLDPVEVKTVISALASSLEPSVHNFLPRASLQHSVETTIITS